MTRTRRTGGSALTQKAARKRERKIKMMSRRLPSHHWTLTGFHHSTTDGAHDPGHMARSLPHHPRRSPVRGHAARASPCFHLTISPIENTSLGPAVAQQAACSFFSFFLFLHCVLVACNKRKISSDMSHWTRLSGAQFLELPGSAHFYMFWLSVDNPLMVLDILCSLASNHSRRWA